MPSLLREDPVVMVMKQVLREMKILNRQCMISTDRLEDVTKAVDGADKNPLYRLADAPAAEVSALDLVGAGQAAEPDDQGAEPSAGDAPGSQAQAPAQTPAD